MWYRARVEEVREEGALLTFTDYGNTELTPWSLVVPSPSHLPKGAILDSHVVHSFHSPAPLPGSPPFSLLDLVRPSSHLLSLASPPSSLEASGLCLGEPGQLVVALGKKGRVVILSQETGAILGSLQGGRSGLTTRALVRPQEVFRMETGQIVVRDEGGIFLFSPDWEFIKEVASRELDQCYGLAEDDQGLLITINHNQSRSPGRVTDAEQTDVFFIDLQEDKVVKRVVLEGVIEPEEILRTKCRFVVFRNGKLYVVDSGMSRIFVFFTDASGEATVEVFGEQGQGDLQLQAPSGLLVDALGNLLVLDTGNSKIKVFDTSYSYVGEVKVEQPLVLPLRVCLDRDRRQFWLSSCSGLVASYRV